MGFLRRDPVGQPIPPRPLDRSLVASQKRIAGQSTDELLLWADNNLSSLGRNLSDITRGVPGALEEARMAAQAFQLVLDELALRVID